MPAACSSVRFTSPFVVQAAVPRWHDDRCPAHPAAADLRSSPSDRWMARSMDSLSPSTVSVLCSDAVTDLLSWRPPAALALELGSIGEWESRADGGAARGLDDGDEREDEREGQGAARRGLEPAASLSEAEQSDHFSRVPAALSCIQACHSTFPLQIVQHCYDGADSPSGRHPF